MKAKPRLWRLGAFLHENLPFYHCNSERWPERFMTWLCTSYDVSVGLYDGWEADDGPEWEASDKD